MYTTQAILPGFSNPVMDSQQAFRKILDAISHPGRIVTFENAPEGPQALSSAATSVCLALVDFETPVWFDSKAHQTADFFKFHCGCPIAELSKDAVFALVADAAKLTDLEVFNLGSNDYPDRSSTVIIDVSGFSNQEGITLRGPGIEHTSQLYVDGVNKGFWEQVQANHSLFPRGIDILLTSGNQLVALPRTTQIEVQ